MENKHSRDDLDLVLEAACDDVAVQTGSSLSSGFDIESLGSMLMSQLKIILYFITFNVYFMYLFMCLELN